MSLQKYFKSKKKLKETIQVAAINQNRTVAGASTHRQNFKNWWVDISISNKNNDETLSRT